MFASLLGAVQADIDRQVDWARNEARRRVRYTARVAIFAGVGILAMLARPWSASSRCTLGLRRNGPHR